MTRPYVEDTRCPQLLLKQEHSTHVFTFNSRMRGVILDVQCPGWEKVEVKDWETFFQSFSYKPNFIFDYEYLIDIDVEKIALTMRVEDSRRPGRWTAVNSSYVLPHWEGERYAREWIRSAVHRLELHESDEWIRFNGELVFDPHK